MSNDAESVNMFRSAVAEGATQEAIKTAFGRLRAIDTEKGTLDESSALVMALSEHAVLCLDRIAAATERTAFATNEHYLIAMVSDRGD